MLDVIHLSYDKVCQACGIHFATKDDDVDYCKPCGEKSAALPPTQPATASTSTTTTTPPDTTPHTNTEQDHEVAKQLQANYNRLTLKEATSQTGDGGAGAVIVETEYSQLAVVQIDNLAKDFEAKRTVGDVMEVERHALIIRRNLQSSRTPIPPKLEEVISQAQSWLHPQRQQELAQRAAKRQAQMQDPSVAAAIVPDGESRPKKRHGQRQTHRL